MFSYEYDFSIVMTYFDRKKQILNTINQFEKIYKNYNFELIIVDDNSSVEHKLNDVINNYTLNIKYILISAEEKEDRVNPCLAYNKGFEQAKGKIVLIQNAECYHSQNLFNFISKNLTSNNYLTFSCYNTSTERISNYVINNPLIIFNREFHHHYMNSLCKKYDKPLWLNFPEYNETNYHFCSAIYNDNLKVLGGFNKDFAKGHSYDDDELLLSIKKNLNLKVLCVKPKNGFVIHQWHLRDTLIKSKDERTMLVKINKDYFNKMKIEHSKYNFKFPKLLHLYWDGSNFSYLNLLTILSFNKHHFGWKINIFCPVNPVKMKSWKTHEQKEEYIGKNYFDHLRTISNVFIHKINFDLLPFKYKNASEVIKSDYFRLYILNKYGGLWSDFDIIYINNIEEYYSNKKHIIQKNMIVYKYNNVYPVGLFLSNKNNSFLNCVLKNIHNFYLPENYQCLGTIMFKNIFHNPIYKLIFANINIKELCLDDANIYLPIKFNETDKLYNDNTIKASYYENNKDIIGIHWFNGSSESKKYCNNLDLLKLKSQTHSCLVDELVKQYI